MRVWRIAPGRFVAEAFSGEGARIFGVRWNSKGTYVVYASTSLALAAIETFINLEPNRAPTDLMKICADVPDDLRRERVLSTDLPDDWDRSRNELLRGIADGRTARGASAILLVPSAVVDGENHVLLNPLHAEFRRIVIGPASHFTFDPRMFHREA